MSTGSSEFTVFFCKVATISSLIFVIYINCTLNCQLMKDNRVFLEDKKLLKNTGKTEEVRHQNKQLVFTILTAG